MCTFTAATLSVDAIPTLALFGSDSHGNESLIWNQNHIEVSFCFEFYFYSISTPRKFQILFFLIMSSSSFQARKRVKSMFRDLLLQACNRVCRVVGTTVLNKKEVVRTNFHTNGSQYLLLL